MFSSGRCSVTDQPCSLLVGVPSPTSHVFLLWLVAVPNNRDSAPSPTSHVLFWSVFRHRPAMFFMKYFNQAQFFFSAFMEF
jgi:hypothetical protein